MNRRLLRVVAATGLAVLLMAGPGYTQNRTDSVPITKQEARRLLDGHFRAVSHMSDLPASVKKAFPDKNMAEHFVMADPGQKWQAGDHILRPDLPRCRLIFAGLSNDCCILHYQRGGYAGSSPTLVFQLSGNKATLLGYDRGWQRFKDLPTLLKHLQTNGIQKTRG